MREEYAHFIADPDALDAKLRHLVPLRGAETVGRWREMASSGDWDALVGDLLVTHYDPTYLRSIRQNFPQFGDATRIQIDGIDDIAFDLAATRVLESQASLP